jgi:hypothetical protein
VITAIGRLDRQPIDPQAARAHAEQFDEDHFRAGIWRVVNRVLSEQPK